MLKKLFLSFISGLFIISNAYAGYLLNPFTGNQDAVPTVEEEDGSPSVYAPSKIKVTNGSLTDNGDGSVSIVTGGGGGGTGDVTDVGDCTGGACFTGSSGNTLTFKGATSGTIALKPAAVAGTNTITLPAETGTIITSATNLAGDVTGTPGATVVGDDSHSHTSATLPANTTYLGSTIEKEEISDATSTPTASKIPIADASGKLDNWITLGSSIEDAEIPSSITRDTEWDTWAEHPALTSGYILVGNASNQAAAVAMSGDATISNTGVVTVADDSHSHTSSTLPANTSYLGSSIEEAELNFSDVTTNNASTTKHGLLPKLSNNSSQYLNGTGNWSTPAGGGSTPGGSVNQLQYNYPSGTFGGTPLIVTDGSNLSVGIGTTGNASRLYIKGAGTTTGFALRIANSQATDRLVVLDNGNVGIGLTSPYGLLQVGTAPTKPGLIVTTSNNVGIGTTNPNYTLHVAGTAATQTLRFGTTLQNILPAGTGANGQVLKTDGTGAITWQADNTGAGGGTPGGSDTQVQFNDAGSFGGDSGFTYNKTTDTATLGSLVLTTPLADAYVADNITLTNITQITNRSHTNLTDIGTNTHAQIDTFIASKGQASGLASLDASSKVVQDPANATATPTASKIPIADGSGKLDGWITLGNSIESSEITDGTIQDADISSSEDVRKAQIHFDIDGGGSAITTGAKAWVRVPFNMIITGWDITADQSGSIVVDVWKDTYTNFPPTVADTIAGSEKPTLSSQQKNQDTNLTTWTTSVSAGDYIRINVDSASTVTKVAVDIYGYKN